MITDYQNEYQEVGAVYFDSVHFLASLFSTPGEIDARAPVPRDFSPWKARCESRRPFLYKKGTRVTGFLEMDACGHIDGLYAAFSHQDSTAPLLEHAIAVARFRGTNRALFVEALAASEGLYRKFGFKPIEVVLAHRSGHGFASVRMCKFL